MTTSPLPWHLDIKPSGLVVIKDSIGREIAQFDEYRDADFLLNFCPERYKELEEEKEKLEYELNDYEFKNGNLKKTIEDLESNIEILVKKLEQTQTK